MANKKFTDLASKATAAAADIIAITDSSDNTSKRTTVGGLVTAILAAIVGAVTPSHWTNPYVFRAYRTASLSSPSGGQAKITFDTESFDDNNNFSGGTYTVPVDGKYQINARFSIATSTAVAFILIYKNGAEFAQNIAEDCGDVPRNMPSWIEIDWEASWENLTYDYVESDGGHIFSQNF